MSNYNPYESRGNVFTGFIGALLGALIGAILWAVIGIIGYIASLVGLVIAFLASKGYDLMKGRPGIIKVVVLIICVIIAVFVGQMGVYAYQIHELYVEKFNYFASEAEFFSSSVPLLFNDSEFVGKMLGDLGMGLLFAALGCFSTLRAAGKKTPPAQQTMPVQQNVNLDFYTNQQNTSFDIDNNQQHPDNQQSTNNTFNL